MRGAIILLAGAAALLGTVYLGGGEDGLRDFLGGIARALEIATGSNP